MLRIFDGVVYDISQRFRCPFEVEYSKSICKLEQDAPQEVEYSEESNQAQLLTDKAA